MTPPHLAARTLPTLFRLAALSAALALGACATAPLPLSTPTAPMPEGTTSAGRPEHLPATAAAEPMAQAPATTAPEAAASALPAPAAADTAPITIDPLRPTEPIDMEASDAHADLWARVRQGVAIADLDNDLVRKWEQWYASRPDYVRRMTERGGRYLFHILEEVNKRGMPTELALLPFIESAFNPQAMSTAKASGMWQFVPATGRDFSLTQNVFRDDRRDVLASTRAALDYLQTLHGLFGDWQLALAAYNWGQGSVQRAITRNQKAGLATTYDSLQMPDETRNYLPKLQAVKNIVLRPEAFALTLPPLMNHPYFVSVGIERDIDLDLAARLAGLPLDEFKQLNPQMNKPVILAAGTPQVLLPYDSANQFLRALARHRGSLASWTAWVAPSTSKPAQVARLVGMDEAQLREINNIPKGMLVKAGSTLLVPRSVHRADDVTEHVADHATLALAPDLPPLRRISFKASRRGDSVVAVARRYRVNVVQVAQWNGTHAGARFRPGQVVTVLVPIKPAQLAARGAPKTLALARPSKATTSHATTRTAKAAAKGSARVVAKAAPSKGGASRRLAKPGPLARARLAQN